MLTKHGFITVHQKIKNSSNSAIFGAKLRQKNATATLSEIEAMGTVFWETFAIILVNYIKNGKTIDGKYYTKPIGLFQPCCERKTVR